MSSAAIVSRRMRDSANAILGNRRIEVMAHHQHVEMLVNGVDGVGASSDWSTTAESFGADHPEDIRCMTTARPSV